MIVETTLKLRRLYAKMNFFHVHAALFTKSMTDENMDYSKKNFAVLNCCACAARRITVMIVRATNLNLLAKDSTKDLLEDIGDRPMSKYRRALHEAVTLKSTNRRFKTSNHLVETYEQTKKVSVTFTRKGKYLMIEYILNL